MSNALAIATVTATLRNLLDGGLNDPDFQTISGITGAALTTRPPDIARDGERNQLNLFLYHTRPNAAFRNADLPFQVRPGETVPPALALDLFYLVTAYGQGNDDQLGHRLLGMAMSRFHDHALLSQDEIEAAMLNTTLHEQIERIRITPHPMNIDEMSKLWTAFQTEYRASTAYQVSVVLIESSRPARTPLPVLQPLLTVQPSLLPPFPTLTRIDIPDSRPSVRLGDTLTLRGHHLIAAATRVLFEHRRLDEPLVLTPLAEGTSQEIAVTLPADAQAAADWPAGLYQVAVEVTEGDGDVRTTNTRPLTLAPEILSISPNPVARDADDTATLTITCRPQVRPAQRVAVLVGGRAVPPQPFGAATDTLTVAVTDAEAGDFFLRLRVDGVDSLIVADYTATPPTFDATQSVEIT